MFAVKDKRTNKFLRGFSGSFNDFSFKQHYRFKNQHNGVAPTSDELHNLLFSLDTPNGAKLYRNRSAVANSFYSYRFERKEGGGRSYRMRPLAEALPWLEIVEVKTSVLEN